MALPDPVPSSTSVSDAPAAASPLDRSTVEGIATSYAGASVFLHQLLLGLALTNAAGLFFTGGTTQLRPWGAYGWVESVLFAALIAAATIRVLDFTAAMPYNNIAYYPSHGGGVLFLVDAFCAIVDALLFYVLSLALAQAREDPLPYFYAVGGILLFESLWCLVDGLFSRYRRRQYLLEAGLNLVTIGIGVVLFWTATPYLVESLIAVTLLRIVVDYTLAPDVVALLRRL